MKMILITDGTTAAELVRILHENRVFFHHHCVQAVRVSGTMKTTFTVQARDEITDRNYIGRGDSVGEAMSSAINKVLAERVEWGVA